jgi:MFS family permease
VTWRDSAAPLRQRSFAWYYASRFTNTLGNTMATVALAFAVLDLTGAAVALGQVLAAHTVPMVPFLLFGGVVADRFPRHLVLRVSNIASGTGGGWCSPRSRSGCWS